MVKKRLFVNSRKVKEIKSEKKSLMEKYIFQNILVTALMSRLFFQRRLYLIPRHSDIKKKITFLKIQYMHFKRKCISPSYPWMYNKNLTRVNINNNVIGDTGQLKKGFKF